MRTEAHPLAGLIPSMGSDEFAALRADIEAVGLIVPITLFEGRILDGRHRYRACRELGVEATTVEYQGDSPVSFVLSQNVRRRHLEAGQLAAVAVESLPLFEAEAKARQADAGGGTGRRGGDERTLVARLPQALPAAPKSRDLAAKAVGTSARAGRYSSS